MSETVMVGLSGGVDSSVCAMLLKEQGFNVVGARMLIWGDRNLASMQFQDNKSNACFGPGEKNAIESARKVASEIDIPFKIVDCSKYYDEIILKTFKNEYIQGRTPNPCVLCNALVKFGIFPKAAKENGFNFDYFATGHYARIEKENDEYLLKRGKSSKKDQSYFLYRLTQEQLSFIRFPLGDYTKEEIREIASKYGLTTANRKDSQDFYQGDYNELFEVKEKIGNIVNPDGKVLGTHKGIWNYTIGQRKGIGIAASEPMYVLELRKDTNEVVIGPRDKTFNKSLIAKNINVVSKTRFEKYNKIEGKIRAKIRSTQEPTLVDYEILDDDIFRVNFDEYQSSIALGQSVVLYDEDIIVAGGIIDSVQ